MTEVYHIARPLDAIPFQHDGGRKAAGYTWASGDCVRRVIAIATGKTYQEVYDDLNQLCDAPWQPRQAWEVQRSGYLEVFCPWFDYPALGIGLAVTRKYLKAQGVQWVATASIGTGCRIHLRRDELPLGRLIVKVSGHMVAVIDGVVHDTHDPSRDGTRGVYGYWIVKPETRSN